MYMHCNFKKTIQATTFLLLLLGFQFSFAGNGSVMGRVTDPDTKAPAADVTVVFENQGSQLSFITNDSGFYYASNLPVGLYDVTAAFMNNRTTVTGVRVNEGDQKNVDLKLSTAIEKEIVEVVTYHVPLIDPIDGDKVKLRREDFKDEPILNLSQLTETQPGVTEVNGQFYVHGAREGSLTYYIDGAPVMANADIPLCGLETYTIYTGFIPPKYGDSVGGVVVLETRNFFAEHR